MRYRNPALRKLKPIDIPTGSKTPNIAKQLDYRQLPLSPDARSKLLQALQHPTATAESVAPILKRQPVACLRLVLLANECLAQNSNQVQRISHAVSLLGLAQTIQLIHQIPNQPTLEPNLCQRLQESWLAAALTEALCEQDESVFISALLMRLHEWCLWQQYPARMKRLSQLHTNPNQSNQQAEQQLLGCELEQLGQQTIRGLFLPHINHTAWRLDHTRLRRGYGALIHYSAASQARFFEREGDLEAPLFDKANLILVTNLLTKTLSTSWFHPRCLRLQKLLATLCRSSLRFNHSDQVSQHLHQLAAEVPTFSPHQLHLGNQLLCGWNHQLTIRPARLVTSKPPIKQPKPDSHQIPIPSATITESDVSIFNNEVLLNSNLERLRLGRFKNLNQLLLCVQESLFDGIGASEAALFVLNKDRSRLRCFSSRADEDKHPLKETNVAIDGAFIQHWLTPAFCQTVNQATDTSSLPNRFQAAMSRPGNAMAALHHREQPLALLSLFHPKLSQQQYLQLQALRDAAAIGIRQLAQQKQRR